MAATERDLIRAADDLTASAESLRVSLDVARRQRKRDRIVIGLGVLMMGLLAVLTGLVLEQSHDNGEQIRTSQEVLGIVREVTSEESQARSQERLQAAIVELDRRLGERITEAFNKVVCEIRGGVCP